MLFHDTSDYVCLSSYYKNESEGNGGRYIFLGRFFSSFRFAGRAPALIYSWSRKCEFLPFSRQRARCTLQWDRRRYHLPGEKRRMKDFPEQRHIIEKGGKKMKATWLAVETRITFSSTPWNFETPRGWWSRIRPVHHDTFLSALKGSRKPVLMIEGRLIFN